MSNKKININKLSDETILKNYNKLSDSIKEYVKSEERRKSILNFLEKEEDRLILAPASPSDHGCYFGGLVEHMIDTIKISLVIHNIFKTLNTKNLPSKESVIICAAFHDIGKLGTEKADNYTVEDSEWHRENMGRNFKLNYEELKLHHSDQGIYLLQKYGIVLTPEEFQAIRTHDGPGYIGNQWKPYIYGDSVDILTHITRISDLMAGIFRRKEDIE